MIKRLFRDTRLQVGFTLFLVWILDIWHFRFDPNLPQIIVYPLLSIAIISALDFGLTWLRYRKKYLPTAPVVSGFLIGLILAPSEPVYVILAASILVSLSKHFLAAGVRRHIFNPAAFGIMGAYFLFGTTVSWWGVSWSKLPLIILVTLMARILYKMHRLYLPLAFLAVYTAYFLRLEIIFDPTILLFALVMLPEPMTSPAVGYFKYLFGALVAIVAILISNFTKIPEVFLPALLLSNFLSFTYLKLKEQAKKV